MAGDDTDETTIPEEKEDLQRTTDSEDSSQVTKHNIVSGFLTFIPRLWGNWISLTGTAITTVSACTIILALAAQAVSDTTRPYTSALAFLVMPAMFIFGLLLIPLGLWFESRRKAVLPDPIQAAFRAAVSDRRARRRIVFFATISFINIVIVGAAGHSALVFMDSTAFCGKLCHSVMEPEYNAYLRSPHSRIKCVECHIGSGASWAVKSKISGLRQVWAVLTGSYHRPIPSPVKELRPARDTCEQCHWPAKFHGNRIAFFTHFESDRENTPQVNALLLKVGGADAHGRYHGIHWHVSPDVQVRYQALDDKRERIGKVTRLEKGKVVAEFAPKESGTPGVGEERVMDCVDCHNRPTHTYDGSAEAAVDKALASGALDRSVPFLREVTVGLLKSESTDREHAVDIFAREMKTIYTQRHKEIALTPETINSQAQALAEIYRRNIYPAMKIGWDTYPNHLGHNGEEEDKRGCFRCHDDKHATKDGKTISQDCDLCHEIMAEDEKPADLPESLQGLAQLTE
jgi:hypothetical protein